MLKGRTNKNNKHAERQAGLLRTALSLLSFNLRSFCLFEVVYRVVGAMVIIPLFWTMLDMSMWAADLKYLGSANLKTLLLNPATWLCACAVIVVAALYALLDICMSILLFEMSRQKRKASIRLTLKAALAQTLRIWKLGNLPIIAIVLIILPATGFVLAPSFVGEFTIPEFILEFITEKLPLALALLAVGLALIFLAIGNMYTFHAFVLEGKDFVPAFRRSRQLVRGHAFRDVIVNLLMQLLVGTIAAALLIVLGIFVFILGCMFQESPMASKVVEVGISSAVLVVVLVALLIARTCGTPLCYALVGALYYRYSNQLRIGREAAELVSDAAGQPASEPAAKLNFGADINFAALEATPSPGLRRLAIGAGLCAYAVAIMTVSVFYLGINVSNGSEVKQVDIVAHRCGASYAPENTVAALHQASKMGATWCELDVQKCADGSIIVLHDESLARTTGLDKCSWEVTYDEVRTLDAGSSFSEEFAGEPVPLLEDMIAAAKEDGMKLQIEIKPTGHDEGIEQDVVDIIHAMDFEDQCSVLSLSLDCIQRVRECDPDIETVYLMSMAYGDIASIEAADSYSIEASWVDAYIEDNVHSVEGSKLCIWTVNKRESMSRAMDMGADQIVTDDIELAADVVVSRKQEQTMLLNVVGFFYGFRERLSSDEAFEVALETLETTS